MDYLQTAARAARRLGKGADREDLHDFRVALRRLCTAMKVFRTCLPIDRSLYRDTRDLARSTGAARDSEVALAWLYAQTRVITPGERAGFQYVCAGLRDCMEREYAKLRAALPLRFAGIERRLRRELAKMAKRANNGEPAFAQIAGKRTTALVNTIEKRFQRFEATGEESHVHAARITVKQLRYLLEPLRKNIANGEPLVLELRDLQELLGDIHDSHVLSGELLNAAETAAGAHLRAAAGLALEGRRKRGECPQSPGILALAGLLHERRAGLFGRLGAMLSAGASADLLTRLRVVAAGLGGDHPPGEPHDDAA